MNIIKQLKANEKPFGLMSQEMQEKAREIKKANFSYFMDDHWNSACTTIKFASHKAYRLCSDYEEEPEIVEWPIFEKDGIFKYKRDLADGGDVGSYLDCALREINFIGFLFEDGTIMASPVKYSVPGQTSKGYYATYGDIKTSQALEHHATHVLFRRAK